jgi:hypothetical protein
VIDMSRWLAAAMTVSTVLLFGAAAWLVWKTVVSAPPGYVALDLSHYLDGTRRWLESGSPYLADEVNAEFSYAPLTFLHPPVALFLFVPFLALPSGLWIGIPLVVIGWSIVSWRPARWAWPLVALAACSPSFRAAVVLGNSDLWVGAFVALGLRYSWPAALIAFKPSLLPFVAIGAGRRAWHVAIVVLAIAAIPFGSLWLDWIAVIDHSPATWSYSVLSLSWLLVLPVSWWSGRPHPATAHRESWLRSLPRLAATRLTLPRLRRVTGPEF